MNGCYMLYSVAAPGLRDSQPKPGNFQISKIISCEDSKDLRTSRPVSPVRGSGSPPPPH